MDFQHTKKIAITFLQWPKIFFLPALNKFANRKLLSEVYKRKICLRNPLTNYLYKSAGDELFFFNEAKQFSANLFTALTFWSFCVKTKGQEINSFGTFLMLRKVQEVKIKK